MDYKSDAVPEYKIFKDHYRGLTKLLFTTNLTPHLIQERVIALADQEKLSAINTSTEKAEVVLQKISLGLEAGLTESFYKMLEIMKSYGNRDAQQLSMTIEQEIAGSKSGEGSVVTTYMDKLSLEFSAAVADIAEILDKSANLNKLKSVCYTITTPEKSLLFSAKKSAAIRASPSVFDVFYELRDHWRWDSHRLLFILIKRSGSQEALAKYEQFKNKVDYTKKLNELTTHFQSVQKSLPPGHTKMIVIIEKDYSDFTLKDCEEIDEYLADTFGSTTLPPPHFEQSSSIKVTWFIPIEAVSGVLSKAYQAKELFKLLSISYFEIDAVVIWNAKWSYSLQELSTKSDSLLENKAEQLRSENMILKSELKILRKEHQQLIDIHSTCKSHKEKVSIAVQTVKVDPSKSQAYIPTAVINKENVIIITLRNAEDDLVSDINKTLKVSVKNKRLPFAVKEVAIGKYEASFTPNRCGEYIISIQIDGNDISGSPYKMPVTLRDYSKIKEQECVQIMKDKEFCQLHDVAIGSNDEVMIIQSSNCVLVFDKKLNLLTKITEKDYIRLFHGTIKDNIIALSDINCDQVIKYSIEGKKLSVIGDGNGSEDGQFNTPRGLAFSGDKLLVVDGDNHRVQVFKQNNDFSFSFGSKGQGPGQFQQPVKIAVDRNANILVSDQVANCIHIFNGEGNFVHKIVHACQQPHAVVVTPMGFLITTHNTENNKITIRKPATYEVINQFGNRGERQGEFDEVGGIAIDSCGNIYMVESKNKRIQMIRND